MVRRTGAACDVHATAVMSVLVPTPPTATHDSAAAQLSPEISTTVSEESLLTGMLRDLVHTPFSSARANTPVPVATSPATSQLPHDTQLTATSEASPPDGDEVTDLSVQLPFVSLNTTGVVAFDEVSAPTATQPEL